MPKEEVKKFLETLIGFLINYICIFEYKNIQQWQIQI